MFAQAGAETATGASGAVRSKRAATASERRRGRSVQPVLLQRRAPLRLLRTLPRTARHSQAQQRRLAVVLSGGGARGAFEVGVIDVLASRGITPDLLIGTSVGAINAAFWAFHPGPDAGRRLLDLWFAANRRLMLPASWLGVLSSLLRGQDHLLQQRSLTRLLERSFNLPALVQDSPIPLVLVATDLVSGNLVRIRTGPLLRGLLASGAIPGLFPPVRIDGQVLVDGGLLANCDVAAAVAAGATDVIAIDLAQEGAAASQLDLLGLLERSVELTLHRQTHRDLAELARASRIAIVRPVLEPAPRFGQFDATHELFGLGQMAGRELFASHIDPRMRVRPGVISIRIDGSIQETDARALVDARAG